MPRKAKPEDYERLQGGTPRVFLDRKKGLWHIVHGYREDSPEVVTHISPRQRGTTIIGGVEYRTSLLWEFEGKPCETESRKAGGEGYNRLGPRNPSKEQY